MITRIFVTIEKADLMFHTTLDDFLYSLDFAAFKNSNRVYFPEIKNAYQSNNKIPCTPQEIVDKAQTLFGETIFTTSEHLILCFQKFVRDGILTCDEVEIYQVSRPCDYIRDPEKGIKAVPRNSGLDVIRLRLDNEGDFLDVWRGGFFRERLPLLR